jgi:hypothetical protein
VTAVASGSSAWGGFVPQATPETAPYWAGCKASRLVLPRCRACGLWIWYPRPFCPACEAWDVEWRESPGRGTLYSFTIVHRPMKGWEARAPYVLAMVDLDEGPRLTATLAIGRPSPENVRVGMRVKVGFEKLSDALTLPVFRPETA